jgi:hypothetical protein
MGRKSLNKTYDQILKENRIRAKKYYEEHKDECKRKAMERYNKLKNGI